jgi:GAF domain-containing protein
MEEIKIVAESKEELYEQLLPQIYCVVADEPNPIANMANIVAALKQTFPYYSWVGFYWYEKKSNELVLGPFQGKIACTRIAVGKGVCGTAFQKKETLIVPDVNQFPGHIFCDGDSKSEIVVPIVDNGNIIGVLDVDSHEYSSFNKTDKTYLEQLIHNVSGKIILP